jgi:hypothetical protein
VRPWLLLGLVAVLTMAAFRSPPSTAAGVGIIEGTLRDGTSDVPLTQHEVVLRVENGASVATTSDAGGAFRFTGVETEGFSYTPEVSFAGLDYEWEPVRFASGQSTVTLSLTVFEPTTDPTSVSLKTASAVVLNVDPDRQILQLAQFFSFENTGSRAYIGPLDTGRPEPVRIRPPDGTLRTQLLGGLPPDGLVQAGSSVAIAEPIPPGLTDVVIAYDVAYSEETKVLGLDFGLAPREAFVLLPEDALSLAGEGLAFDRVVDLQGLRVARYRAAVDGSSPMLLARVGGLPLAEQPPSPDSNAGRTAAVVAAAAAVLAVAWYGWRRRRPTLVGSREEVLHERDALLREILELDGVPERTPSVEQRRLELVQRLRGLR